VDYTPPSAWSGVAIPYPNQNREPLSAYAYPDFCPTVDGATPNNTCLNSAVAGLGLNFGVLEVPPVNPSGTVATNANYICTSLGAAWPNPTRVSGTATGPRHDRD
jgi:hypothetical protein